MAEDGPGREHLCHTDTFLVFILFNVYIILSDVNGEHLLYL